MKVVRLLPVVALLLGNVAGCGGVGKYAKVSGVVRLDGKPYPNATVSFQPLATKGKPNPGRGSTGLTDHNGKYILLTDDGHSGAVVGKHRIRIRTKVEDPTNVFDPTTGSPDSPPVARGKKADPEPIPAEWFADHTTKEFDVPPGGTNKADFEIVTKKGKG